MEKEYFYHVSFYHVTYRLLMQYQESMHGNKIYHVIYREINFPRVEQETSHLFAHYDTSCVFVTRTAFGLHSEL